MIDDLLERFQDDFMEEVWPGIKKKDDEIITPLPLSGIEHRFEAVM